MQRMFDNTSIFIRSHFRESVEGKSMLTPQQALESGVFAFPPTKADREHFFVELGKLSDSQNWFRVLGLAAKYRTVFPNDSIPGVDTYRNINEQEDSRILLQVTQEACDGIVHQEPTEKQHVWDWKLPILFDASIVYPEQTKQWISQMSPELKEAMFATFEKAVNSFSNGSVNDDAGKFLKLFPEFTERMQKFVTPETWQQMQLSCYGRRYGDRGNDIDCFISDSLGVISIFPKRRDELQLTVLGEKIWQKMGDRQDHHRAGFSYFWHQAADIAELMRFMSDDPLGLISGERFSIDTRPEELGQVRIPAVAVDPLDPQTIYDIVAQAEKNAHKLEERRRKLSDIQSYFYTIFTKSKLHNARNNVTLDPFKIIDNNRRAFWCRESYGFKRHFGLGRKTLGHYNLELDEVGPNYPDYSKINLEMLFDNEQPRVIRFYWQNKRDHEAYIPNFDENEALGRFFRHVEGARRGGPHTYDHDTKEFPFRCLEVELDDFFRANPKPGALRLLSSSSKFSADNLPKDVDIREYRFTHREDLGFGVHDEGARRYSYNQLLDIVHNLVQIVPTELKEVT